LFDKEKLKNIIKNFNKLKAMNYYNAILQNLFFATLNQQRKDRKFAKDENIHTNREEYGVKNLYRYRNKFLIRKDIPFLNGGLFDCLDKIDESGKVIYIDGFSRNPKKEAKIPDELFFGTKKKA
jgi:adenine-specific DNA-methyltransferase